MSEFARLALPATDAGYDGARALFPEDLFVWLTAYAQRQWDAPARANLRREFDRLR